MSRSKRKTPTLAQVEDNLKSIGKRQEHSRQEDLVARLEDAADTVAGAVNKLVKVIDTLNREPSRKESR